MTGLLSTKYPATRLHGFQDVAVADRYLMDGNPTGCQAPPES